MKCRKAARMLPALIAGELDRAGTGELERHLAGCADCRAALAGFEADRTLLRESPAPEPGPWFVSRVMAAVRAGPAPGAARPAWVRALAGAAMALLVAGGVWAGATVGADLAGPVATDDPLAVNAEPALTEYVDLTIGNGR